MEDSNRYKIKDLEQIDTKRKETVDKDTSNDTRANIDTVDPTNFLIDTKQKIAVKEDNNLVDQVTKNGLETEPNNKNEVEVVNWIYSVEVKKDLV